MGMFAHALQFSPYEAKGSDSASTFGDLLCHAQFFFLKKRKLITGQRKSKAKGNKYTAK
jgi:hypothetical protein